MRENLYRRIGRMFRTGKDAGDYRRPDGAWAPKSQWVNATRRAQAASAAPS